MPAGEQVQAGWLRENTSSGTLVLCWVKEHATKSSIEHRFIPVTHADLNEVTMPDDGLDQVQSIHRFEVPVRLESTANKREHWRTRHTRAKTHRNSAFYSTPHNINPPCIVTITRVAPGRPLDDDNLAISAKSVRDGIADRLGIDDGSDQVKWNYAQEKATKRGHYTCMVEIRTLKKGEA